MLLDPLATNTLPPNVDPIKLFDVPVDATVHVLGTGIDGPDLAPIIIGCTPSIISLPLYKRAPDVARVFDVVGYDINSIGRCA